MRLTKDLLCHLQDTERGRWEADRVEEYEQQIPGEPAASNQQVYLHNGLSNVHE